ncbi:unnamed protein product [Gordionus sp. m RMFG-2023]
MTQRRNLKNILFRNLENFINILYRTDKPHVTNLTSQISRHIRSNANFTLNSNDGLIHSLVSMAFNYKFISHAARKLFSTSSIFRIYVNKSHNLHVSSKLNCSGRPYEKIFKKIDDSMSTKRMIPGVVIVLGIFGILYGYNTLVFYWMHHPTLTVEEVDSNGKKIIKKIKGQIFQEMPPREILAMNPSQKLYSLDTLDKITGSHVTKESENIDLKEENPKLNHQKDNMNIKNIPEFAQYLLIGGGTASFSAARTIRINSPKSKILIVSEEDEYPYIRPPLSKDLWYEIEDKLVDELRYKSWDGKQKSVYFEDESFYYGLEEWGKEENRGGIFVLKNSKVTKLNPANSEAHLDNGIKIKYEKCLIATGGTPAQLPSTIDVAPDARKSTSYFRNINDFRKLLKTLKPDALDKLNLKSVTVLGGGFLGSELASSIAHKSTGKISVNQIISSDGILAKILPKYLSEWATSILQHSGINIIRNSTITSVKTNEKRELILHLSNGTKLTTDHLIVAIGINPNIGFIQENQKRADLKSCLVVDKTLKYKDNIWAAGDVMAVQISDQKLARSEHYDNAINSGQLAGFNMTGSKKEFNHLLHTFWSDLGSDLGIEGVGTIDSSLNTFSFYAHEDPVKNVDDSAVAQNLKTTAHITQPSNKFKKGVLFYIKDDIIVGVLTINLFGQMDVAKKLIMLQTKSPDLDKLAKLFDIHTHEAEHQE